MTNYIKALTKVLNTLTKLGFELPMAAHVSIVLSQGRGYISIHNGGWHSEFTMVELGLFASEEELLAYLADGRKSARFLKKALLNTVIMKKGEFEAGVVVPEVTDASIVDVEYQRYASENEYTHDEDGNKYDTPVWDVDFDWAPVYPKTAEVVTVATEDHDITEEELDTILAQVVAAPTPAADTKFTTTFEMDANGNTIMVKTPVTRPSITVTPAPVVIAEEYDYCDDMGGDEVYDDWAEEEQDEDEWY
ncbi:MAG: hypothetical protein ACRDCE_18010 [Cetobacterium sp.]|uniref:hypothetical protein n=1 Tax=Cetobacterium sp. TaxID=2071632 RepID=UPI003EE506DF